MGVVLAAGRHRPELPAGTGAGQRSGLRPHPRADAPATAESFAPLLAPGRGRVSLVPRVGALAAERRPLAVLITCSCAASGAPSVRGVWTMRSPSPRRRTIHA